MRSIRRQRTSDFTARIGTPDDAQRITVNLSGEIGDHLRDTATKSRVSESSVVEIALRELFRRVTTPALGAFLRDRGGCLRRRKT